MGFGKHINRWFRTEGFGRWRFTNTEVGRNQTRNNCGQLVFVRYYLFLFKIGFRFRGRPSIWSRHRVIICRDKKRDNLKKIYAFGRTRTGRRDDIYARPISVWVTIALNFKRLQEESPKERTTIAQKRSSCKNVV